MADALSRLRITPCENSSQEQNEAGSKQLLFSMSSSNDTISSSVNTPTLNINPGDSDNTQIDGSSSNDTTASNTKLVKKMTNNNVTSTNHGQIDMSSRNDITAISADESIMTLVNGDNNINNHASMSSSNDIARNIEIRSKGLETKLRNVIPLTKQEKVQLIQRYHNETVGHYGAKKTRQAMQSDGIVWAGMSVDIGDFVRSCGWCQSRETAPPITRAIPFNLGASRANEIACIDFIQDINMDSEGFKHILVFIDAFTRLVTLYPTKDVSFNEIMNPLLSYCCFFGTPRFLHSDNASSFLSEPFAQLIKLLQVSQSLSAPYSHEQNAIVERVIRSIRERMDELRAKHPRVDWSTLCLLAQRAINAIGSVPTKFLALA